MDTRILPNHVGIGSAEESVKKTLNRINRRFCFVLSATILVAGGMLLVNKASSAEQADDGWKIAMRFDIHGKGHFNSCLPFAKDLYNRMTKAGGESHLIIYDWSDHNLRKGRHAVIVYRDGDGRYWGMDNRTRQPKWLKGETAGQWVQSFEWGSVTQVVSHETHPSLAGKTADLSRLEGVASNDKPRGKKKISLVATK